MTEKFNISGRIVVMTGACGVLGSTIVKYFAGEGAKVVLLDLERTRETGERLVAEIKATGGEALFLPTNVLEQGVLENNLQDILAAYGGIDVLLNAAGGNMSGATIAPDKTYLDLDTAAFRNVVDLNLFGTVLPTKVFGGVMCEKKEGCIVNFCSEAALRPFTRVVGYSAAKSAIASYTKFMAAEMAMKYSPRIRVNAIVPGFIITNQNRTLLTNEDGSLTDRGKTIIAHTPAGRFSEPEELLGTIHYLISEASSFVTGALSIVDGGFDAFSI